MTNLPNQAHEEWRAIKGFEGLYEVSDLGRVRSLERTVRCRYGVRIVRERIMRQSNASKIYWAVVLSDRRSEKHFRVHRLVAAAFVPGSGEVVRHLDGNGFNNRRSNLAWGSYNENEADKKRHGRTPSGLNHGMAIFTSDDVRKIRSMHAEGFTQLEIASATGFKRGAIGYLVRGETYQDVA